MIETAAVIFMVFQAIVILVLDKAIKDAEAKARMLEDSNLRLELENVRLKKEIMNITNKSHAEIDNLRKELNIEKLRSNTLDALRRAGRK